MFLVTQGQFRTDGTSFLIPGKLHNFFALWLFSLERSDLPLMFQCSSFSKVLFVFFQTELPSPVFFSQTISFCLAVMFVLLSFFPRGLASFGYECCPVSVLHLCFRKVFLNINFFATGESGLMYELQLCCFLLVISEYF